MNRTRSIRAAAVAAAALLAADAAAVNFPLGTFIYAGCAMNYRHEVLTEDDGVPEIEVLGDLASKATTLILVK